MYYFLGMDMDLWIMGLLIFFGFVSCYFMLRDNDSGRYVASVIAAILLFAIVRMAQVIYHDRVTRPKSEEYM